jgi:hypothetical protein
MHYNGHIIDVISGLGLIFINRVVRHSINYSNIIVLFSYLKGIIYTGIKIIILIYSMEYVHILRNIAVFYVTYEVFLVASWGLRWAPLS